MLLSQWNSDPDFDTTEGRTDGSPKTRDGAATKIGAPDLMPGDIVRVEEGIGVVRYMGQVRFAKGLWAGVELVEKMGMHDGQVGGKRYFRCKPKHGIFVDVANVRKKILPEQLLERVTLLNSEVLDLRSENDKLATQVRVLESKLAGVTVSVRDAPPEDVLEDLRIGDRVRLSNRKTGTVKFIGRTRGDPTPFIGLEMHSWISNGNDGTKSGRRYFNVRPGWGYFARKTQIVEIIQKSQEERETAPRLNIVLGDRVEIDRNRRGVVKFIGHVAFSKDEMVGLELDTWASYAHDGTKGGKRYFKAQHGKGYFCKLENVVRVLKSEDGSEDEEEDSGRQTRGGPFNRSPRHSPRNRSPRRSPSPRRFTPSSSPRQNRTRGGPEADPQNRDRDSDDDLGPSLEQTAEAKKFEKTLDVDNLQVGDKIRLARGKIGRIKYIGHVEFASGEVIGLELSAWTERGHDGSVMGKRYFETASGRGYFTKRSNIAEVITRANKSKAPKPEMKSDPKDDLQVGDRVRLKRGKSGVIKFMGRVKGINRECVIGLELDTIGDERGHDGCSPLDATRIFDCLPGHGYWTSKEAIVEVMNKKKRRKAAGRGRHRREGTDMVGLVQEYIREKKLVDFRIGDTVRLSRGKEGIVRYIGRVEGMKREDIVGLELKVWTERGHDGSYKGKQYFTCPPGRGYFTSRDAVAEVLEHAAEKKEKPAVRTMVSGENAPEEGPLLEIEKEERVRLRNGRTGTVWFIGNTDFAKGEVVGLELDQWTPNGHDGSMKGQRYFECPPGHGYFTRRAAIVEKLGQSRRRRTPASSPRRRAKQERASQENSMSDERAPDSDLKFKVGDKVRLKRGKRGIVRYIGPVEGASQDVVGLELEQWFERGNDGSFKGRRYFDTRGDGWGYFTKPSSIAAIIHDDDEP